MEANKRKKPKKSSDKKIQKAEPIKSIPAPLMAMDGTSINQISDMKNEEYSGEIIKKADKKFNYEKFDNLKDKNLQSYLKEGKKQIIDQWHAIEALSVHNEKYTVRFLINIGTILNDIEASLKIKSKYMKWLRKNFGHKHMRYFQHAKQLAKMGDFAYDESALGKNRLLAFSRIISDPKANYKTLFSKYQFKDITEDHDGLLFKQHVDSIITLHRMTEAGIGYIKFSQAELIASILKSAIPINLAKKNAKWLAKFKTVDKKNVELYNLILNHLQFPDQSATPKKRQVPLNEHLAYLVNFSKKADLTDEPLIRSLRGQVERDDLISLHQFILGLAEKLNIRLTQIDGDKVTILPEGKRRAA